MISIKNLFTAICILSLSLTSFKLSAQGPIDGYMKGAGEISYAYSFGNMKADGFFAKAADGSININKGYKREMSMQSQFVAIGLSNRINLIATLPKIEHQYQDIAVYGKFKLHERELSFGRLRMIAALGGSKPTTAYRTEATNNAIGQQAFTANIRAIWQLDFYNGFFAQFRTGHTRAIEENIAGLMSEEQLASSPYTFTPTVSSTPISIKAGYATSKIYVDAWLERQTTFDQGGDFPINWRETGFAGLGVDYTKLGGTLYYSINQTFGGALAYATVLNGRNMFDLNMWNLSFVVNLKTQNKKEEVKE